ncbi:MAG: hypothetical protein ACQESK_08615 [Bacteroidota bacterium]
MKNLNKNSNLKSGFKIPENYFENFRIQKLAKAKKATQHESGFSVPKGYFENFEVNSKEQKESKVIALNSRKIVAIAASISLLFLSYLLMNKSNNESINSTYQTVEIDPVLLEDYIDFYIMPNAELFEYTGSSIEFDIAENDFKSLDDDAILNYFEDDFNNLDLND